LTRSYWHIYGASEGDFDMLKLLMVEDNERLQKALVSGLNATGLVEVFQSVSSGEAALEYCLTGEILPEAILMDVALAGAMNGIEAAIDVRREFPRLPVVFY
jgi:CheY-like chemotaxis protein